ncbi:MAG: formimidoylglutamase, partial [Flavobacteriaceae bacterium]|nr:formimidoylglutamase [Flavobacteriaceae bacterium]
MDSYLSPVQDLVLAHNELMSKQVLGKKIKIHSAQNGIPELQGVDIALFGVLENRNDINFIGEDFQLNEIRKSLYELFPGNWNVTIADLGNIEKGETTEDTYFALRSVVSQLLEQNIIPLIIGGSQDLTYANYRAYDNITPMVNIVNVDKSFDLGDSSKPIKNNSYLGKVILEKPYNLFNYSTIGYQTYFNSQEEIDLMDKLYFEAYRLGEVTNNISFVEPVLRDANIVSIDLRCIRASEVSTKLKYSPNGFDGKEICSIARYAGISNKVSSFGLYEYKPSKDDESSSMLMAQIIWYFIEGVNCRVEDDPLDKNHIKYTVLIEDEELIFYKSTRTGRWWIEIPFLPNVNN